MRSNLSLALALILMTNCASRTDSQRGEAPSASQNIQALMSTKPETVASPGGVSAEAEKEKDIPPEFAGVDFKNFSYPIGGKQVIQLKDGEYEYSEDKILGGNGWFNFAGVSYADLTGDGKKEAIVRVIWVACGVSCDGGSHLLYFYSRPLMKPILLWQVATGSLAYGCGLKSLAIYKGTITLEVFKNCHFDGVSFKSKSEPGFKFDSGNALTRFLFEFDGRAFALKKREVFPYPQEDVKNFEPEIRITHD